MSADNGIYKLTTKSSENSSKVEIRVAYAHAIDNINYDPEGNGQGLLYLVSIFGNSKVYHTEEEAAEAATAMENEFMSSPFPVLEYGIVEINRQDTVFPDMTVEEANSKLKEMWNAYNYHRSQKVKVSNVTVH